MLQRRQIRRQSECDATGRIVRTLLDARQTPGLHEIPWDGCDECNRLVANGTYILN